jgi:hypothetical protein
MKAYVLAVNSHPWLFPPIEEALGNLDQSRDSEVLRLSRSIRTATGRPISDDEILVAFNALCDLGILERSGSRFRFNRAQFEATLELRRAIQSTIAILGEGGPDITPSVQLCVSLPPSLSSVAEHVIRESSADLRSSLLDVATSAKQSLIVASPFWDADTTSEMVALAQKKRAANVKVCLLGRFSKDLPNNVKVELHKIANDPGCEVLSWFEGSGKEAQTFHFKAISADRGLRGYVGSANMTVSSLRSRMELGLILTGNAASQLERILRVVLTMAVPVSL